VRFHKEEENNEPKFAKKLASHADLYVNHDFGTTHGAHASTKGVAKYLKPYVSGFLISGSLMLSHYIIGIGSVVNSNYSVAELPKCC